MEMYFLFHSLGIYIISSILPIGPQRQKESIIWPRKNLLSPNLNTQGWVLAVPT